MNVEVAFWAMVEEVSSRDELNKLNISWTFKPEDAEVYLYYTITESEKPAFEKTEKQSDGAWEVKMMFDFLNLNLADPNSFEKLKAFIKKAKQKEMPTFGNAAKIIWQAEEVKE
jgi:hypothetical protein